MALECFTWIAQFLGSLFYAVCRDEDRDEDVAETFRDLPDSLVIDILSRLPADTLLMCRRVCRDWRTLISSHYFTILHLSKARPMLLIRDDDRPYKRLWLWDLYFFSTEELNKMEVFKKVRHLEVYSRWDNLMDSCQGVLLFCRSRVELTYYVLNPVTREGVTVKHALYPGTLCALYFCPVTMQFRLLYVQIRGCQGQYLVYTFKTQTWRKILSSTFKFTPCRHPVVLNGALHWITANDLETSDTPLCANGIMVFRIDNEELSTMPHPGSVCRRRILHATLMTLFVKDGHLAFCHVPEYHCAVYIWILTDYERQRWSKRYKVKLSDETIFPYGLPYTDIASIYTQEYCMWIKLLCIHDGELLFYLEGRGFILYNLDHKTAKRFEGSQWESVLLRDTVTPYIKSLLAIA